jgi:hypothetical protein
MSLPIKNAKKILLKGMIKKGKNVTPTKKGPSSVHDAISGGLSTLSRGGGNVTGGSGENLGITGGAKPKVEQIPQGGMW